MDVEPLETITPAAHTCFQLHLDRDTNLFKVSADAPFVFFAEHRLAELAIDGLELMSAPRSAMHTLELGAAVGDRARDDEGHEDGGVMVDCTKKKQQDKRWGAALGASLLVNMCTLVGVAILAMGVMPMMKLKKNQAFLQVRAAKIGAYHIYK